MLWAFEGTWGEEDDDDDDDEKHNPRTLNESPEDRTDRCTRQNCRVKKRIERLAEEPRMVITGYEGRRVHSAPRDEDESQPSSDVTFFW